MVVTLVIAILLVGTTSFISALGYTSYVRNAIGIVLTPVQKGANSIFDSISNIFSSKEDYIKLKKENDELKKLLAEKEEALAKGESALNENEKLKEYLGIKDEHTDFVLTDANVTGREANSNSSLFTIDRGTRHGITPGMPVITETGLAGIIREVGLTWSKVSFVTSTDISIGVCVEKNNAAGILKGSFKAEKDGLCTMTYIDEKYDVQIGDRIVTSGSDNGSKYPKGLFIGTVTDIEINTVSREKTAYITPVSDISQIRQVMIITEFETVYE